MKYIMRQKLWSWGNDFVIKDESGNDAFFVDGKVFALRDQLSLADMAGNEICLIQKKILAWGPTYEMFHQGQLVATVKESLFTLLGHRFYVDVPGPDDIEAAGNFTDHEYTFSRGGQAVAAVSKSWFTWADTYGVDVTDDSDAPLILVATVVIERCSQQQKSPANTILDTLLNQ
jgi:uncharacterized protein YxjI